VLAHGGCAERAFGSARAVLGMPQSGTRPGRESDRRERGNCMTLWKKPSLEKLTEQNPRLQLLSV